jgi:hypothetical protein
VVEVRVGLLVLSLLVATVGVALAGGDAARVTLIGDSVASAIPRDRQAMALLGAGVDVQVDTAPCRRLEVLSCPHEGSRPTTTIEEIQRRGAGLGDTVVIAVGYNDPEDEYAREIDAVVAALHAAGVSRILWLTLREVRHPYVTMNAAIAAAAARTPGMTMVDWNAASRTFPGWFALVRRALGAVGAAPVQPVLVITPPRGVTAPARVGRRLSVPLAARNGVLPYRWKRLDGLLPRGVHVERSGAIEGVPREPGRFRLTVRVTDAVGVTAERPLTLTVVR